MGAVQPLVAVVQVGAVEGGPEVEKERRRMGLGIPAWFCIVWLTLLIGAAVFLFFQAYRRLQNDPIRERLAAAAGESAWTDGRPSALMTPTVTVWLKLKGLPMATTKSPGCI